MKKDRMIVIISYAVLLVLIMPLLYVARYNVMCADDFQFGLSTHQIWTEQGIAGIGKILKAAGSLVVNNWKHWGGNYSSGFFSALQPGIFSDKLVFLNTIILIGSLIGASEYLWRTIGQYILENKSLGKVMSCGTSILIILWMPYPEQGLYWFNGAFYNIVGVSAGIIFMTLLWKNVFIVEKISITTKILLVLLAIFTAGTNYTTIVPWCIVLVLGCLGCLTILKISQEKLQLLIGMTACFLIFAGINILAPGNGSRMDSTGLGTSALLAIVNSIRYARIQIFEYITYQIVVFAMIIVPFIKNDKWGNKLTFVKVLFISIASFLLFASSFAPTMYAVDGLGPGRTRNVYYVLFCHMFFLNTCMWVLWLRSKCQKYCEISKIEGRNTIIKYFIIILILAAFFLNRETITSTNTVAAVELLLNGEAKQYHYEMMQRKELYLDDTIEDVVIERLSVVPHLIYFDDIMSEPDHWRNQWVAEYYGKNSVRMEAE